MKKESFGRQLFALVLPMAVQNLFSSLVSASDALMLGFLDQMSLSAVSLATTLSRLAELTLTLLENCRKGTVRVRLHPILRPDSAL